MSDTSNEVAPEAETVPADPTWEYPAPVEAPVTLDSGYIEVAPEGAVEDAPASGEPSVDDLSTASAVPEVTANAVAAEAVKTRAAASDLEGDLRSVLNDYVTGQIVLGENVKATPHTLAGLIAGRRADGKAVSSGAVSAALNRWAEVGFITLDAKPMAFADFTDEGRAKGLSALKAENKAAKSAARVAAKASTAPAPAPVAEAPAPAAEPEAAPAVEVEPQPEGDTPF